MLFRSGEWRAGRPVDVRALPAGSQLVLASARVRSVECGLVGGSFVGRLSLARAHQAGAPTSGLGTA